MSAPATAEPRHLAGVVLAVVAALALLLAGCSEDTDTNEPAAGPGEQQPAVGGGLAQGVMAEVPVPSAAVQTGGLAEEDDVQTQSYEVVGTQPLQVMEFYEEELPPLGWEGGVREDFGDGFRAFWEMDEFELLVATSPTPDEQDTELRLQISDLQEG